MSENKLLLTKKAASILRVSEEYFRFFIRSKKIPVCKKDHCGGYRISTKK